MIETENNYGLLNDILLFMKWRKQVPHDYQIAIQSKFPKSCINLYCWF